ENKGFVPDFLKNLEYYDWPGNTRELISSLERAVLADPESPTLYPNNLPTQIRMQHLQTSIDKNQNGPHFQDVIQKSNTCKSIDLPDNLFEPIKSLKQIKDFTISETEKIYLKKLLQLTHGDLDQASILSCLSKGRIYSLLKKHDMSRSV
ncbi:sigma-54-dependent Fis family transcriptional regulator, partial [bacterium]|nr:sigma-54-dependent Fis family transcriptional regulator [bacterium]